MKAKSNESIFEFLKPYAENLNLEIVEVEFKVSKNPTLTVYIDKDGGVDLDTCELFHNAINAPLDEFDPYPQAYTLNVSSPGVDRPFKTARDFEKNIGKMVEVKLFAPLNGKKFYEGELVSFDGNNVTINVLGNQLKIELNKIAKINQAIIFD
ncbi:MAG: ribosome maturation factor RimP [Clostridia bacterium]|nr:ribosome maturation factor RimP [Clostridia bacterium]